MKKILLGLLIVLSACSSNGGGDGEGDSYNRTALLTNWADNIIVPSYENYQTKVSLLVTNTSAFTTTPTVVNLQTLRTSWLEAYKAYQHTSMYNFGKAEELFYVETSNTYPANAAGIDANISTGTYNLSLISQYDKQGFPALDYLINGLGTTDAAIVGFYSTNANAVKYKNYLTTISSKLKLTIDVIVNDWNSSYRDNYIANNGNAVNSSVNKTTNNFVKNLEKNIRTGKVGIPSGLFSAGTKFPEKVEAYYKNDVSKILLDESIRAAQGFFNGKHFDSTTTGESLKNYLDFLNTIRDGQKLSDIINAQFNRIYITNNLLSSSFSQQINTNNTKMIASYNDLQQNIIYLKLDMMQALNISIDYVDSDGD